MKKRDVVRAKALSLVGCPYVWGGTGAKCTVRYRKARMAQYPGRADGIRSTCPALRQEKDVCVPGCKYIGKPAVDCAQLVRISCKAAGITLPSGASSQWKRGPWVGKGPIAEMPMDRVCVVFRESPVANPMVHVGLYLGDGTVVDARGSRYGVLRKPVTAYPWTHYALLPGMDEEITTPDTPDLPPSRPGGTEWHNPPSEHSKPNTGNLSANIGMPTLRRGHRGADVQRMQELLTRQGYPVDTDGIFGRGTLAAVKAFQAANGLKVDGVVGRMTWTALTEGR